jgi:hypothetical protein
MMPVESEMPVRWAPFLAGFAILLTVLLATSALDATGRWGIAILAAVLLTALAVERVLYGIGPREAVSRLGLGRPGGRALVAACAVGALVLLVYPILTAITGAVPALRPDWPWLLIGIVAFHGVAEELVWRGYAYRRLRVGRSFGRAVLWTMPLVAPTTRAPTPGPAETYPAQARPPSSTAARFALGRGVIDGGATVGRSGPGWCCADRDHAEPRGLPRAVHHVPVALSLTFNPAVLG